MNRERVGEGDNNIVVGGCYLSEPFADEGLELSSEWVLRDYNHTNRSNEMEDIGFRCCRRG